MNADLKMLLPWGAELEVIGSAVAEEGEVAGISRMEKMCPRLICTHELPSGRLQITETVAASSKSRRKFEMREEISTGSMQAKTDARLRFGGGRKEAIRKQL